ncbi:MAG: tyrosine-type recombinase/integrase, partial [Terriglobales bacterium]
KAVLTDRDIIAIPTPVKGDTFVWDAAQPYLSLRISRTGARSWCFIRSNRSGRNVRVKIGSWPEMTTEQARAMAREIIDSWNPETGVNLDRVENKYRRKVATYSTAFQAYVNGHLRVFRKATSVRDAESGFRRFCERFHDVPVGDITSLDVQTWVNWLGDSAGQSTANRQFNVLKACLRWCDIHGIIELKKDPTAGVRLFREQGRQRYVMPHAEMPRLKEALDARPGTSSDAIWMLLLTAQRKSTVLSMEWSEIDFANRLWLMPAEKLKQQRNHVVPLSDLAMDVLTRRFESRETAAFGDYVINTAGSRWVFPSYSGSGHITDIDHAWQKIRGEAGLEDVHLHDLRHTAASMMGITGASAFQIQQALGHSTSRMSERYTHLNTESIRAAIEAAQRLLMPQDNPSSSPDDLALRRTHRKQRLVEEA